MQEIARQREEELRRAGRHGDTVRPGLAANHPVTAARTTRPGGEPMRSKLMILVALLPAAFR